VALHPQIHVQIAANTVTANFLGMIGQPREEWRANVRS
jgi:hypothetical protein